MPDHSVGKGFREGYSKFPERWRILLNQEERIIGTLVAEKSAARSMRFLGGSD